METGMRRDSMLIDCKSISKAIDEDVKRRIEKLGFSPKLVAITSKPDPSTITYLNSQQKKAKKLGIEFEVMEGSTMDELLKVITKLANDDKVHGIFLTHPLPEGIDEFELTLRIPPEKDVEGRTPYNLGMLIYEKEYFPPCTAEAAVRILENVTEIRGKNVVVIGRSVTVGKPVEIMLLKKGRDATVTVCHSKTRNLKEITKAADALIVAAGRPKLVTKDMVKEGAYVIDVGINVVDDQIVGDVDPEVEQIAHLTPVPGGVGRVTTSLLMEHVVRAAERAVERDG